MLKDKVQELLGTNTTLSNDRLKYENMYKEMKSKYEIDSDAQLKDISDKLFQYDKNAFRETMQALKYDGNDPEWHKNDTRSQAIMNSDNPVILHQEIERLRQVNRDVSAEFEKT